MIQNLKGRILLGGEITREEAIALSKENDKESLYLGANQIREKLAGNKMDLCSITNARSGKCSENCKWCSQSAHFKTHVETYELIDSKEAVSQARKNAQYGVNRYSLVTSGRALNDVQIKKVVGIYKEIRKECSIHLCASMGLLKKEQLQQLREGGVEHYHCNLETAPSFFPQLCSSHTVEEKIQTIQWAQEVGLKVCSGGIIGMGETMEQRIEMAFTLKELGIKSIPLNILNPIKGTPLEGTASLTDEEILITIAVFRFINPDAHLRFAGGRLKIRHIQEKALKAGINAALVGDLLTTIGSNVEEDIQDFQDAGFEV